MIRGRHRQRGEGPPVEQRAGVRGRRRIELELGIARPPVRVPCPRRRAAGDDVPEPVELAGVIVEAEWGLAERRDAESDCVRHDQRERDTTVASHRRGSYFKSGVALASAGGAMVVSLPSYGAPGPATACGAHFIDRT